MQSPFAKPVVCAAAVTIVLVAVLFPSSANAQQPPPPWTGVVMNEASREGGPAMGGGSGYASQHAISGDARFVVLSSQSPLDATDTNGLYDVYVRDRHNGFITRASLATGGAQGNGMSFSASISRDGRHVTFHSCASNLDPADTNGQCDTFVHDRMSGTTSKVSFGPNGEQVDSGYSIGQLSALSMDGRFVVFTAAFPQTSAGVYLRDRDPDVNGVFDEAGLATTVRIDVSELDGQFMGGGIDVAINSDGSLVAYNSYTNDENWNSLGPRLYLYDRTNDTTVRVDRPLPSSGDVESFTHEPDFSDNGLLVFASNAPNLVAEDGDAQPDIFVYDVATTQRTRLTLTHANAPDLNFVYGPSISADGRYVTFTGEDGVNTGLYDVYAIDRQTSASYEISVRYDGTRDNWAGFSSISADGTAIAFSGSWQLLAEPGGYGVYVSTAVSVSPDEATVPTQTTSSVSVEVNVPADTRWWGRLIQFLPDQYSMALGDIYEGIGPMTVDVEIPGPMGYEEEDWYFAVGTEMVLIHRRMMPEIMNVNPYIVSPAGGSVFTVNGNGFAQGATVLIGDVPATDVVVDEYGYWINATAPAHEGTNEFLPVTVVNPNGYSATEENGVIYYGLDPTPPVIEPQLTGTQGQNSWWVSNVSIGWTLNDPESELYDISCPNVEVTEDSAYATATCTASSDGGTSSTMVQIKRDATPPVATLYNPVDPDFIQGQEVNLDFACDDETSGVASCTTSQGLLLDTSAVGTHQLTVTAVDRAGLTGTSVFVYNVKTNTSIYAPSVTSVYGGTANLWAWMLQGGPGYTPPGPLGGKMLTFFVDNVAVGTAVTAANGQVTLPLTGMAAGTYPMRVEFAGDATYRPSAYSSTLTINKATPGITWPTPSAIAYGAALSATQLNASASVAGSFSYDPAAGTVLGAGPHTLSVSFTPTDTANYNSAATSVSITVSKGNPILTWNNPAAITYGTALSATQLNASASVAGSFSYDPAAGTVLSAGTHSLTASFTPTDTANYNSGSTGATITVAKADPILTWNNPAAITYGTALSATQLNASASVAGSFSYDPAAGTVLSAGTHSLTASFTPTDTANYNSGSTGATVTVSKADPVLTWNNPAAIGYGTALSATQLNASSSAAGSFSYDPAAGTVLSAGTHSLTASFTPTDTANYNSGSTGATITVSKSDPVLTWNNPAAIGYGTALSATQLNASASVAGSFSYDPAAGTVLSAGTHSLTASFTPTDTANYNSGSTGATITVSKSDPVLTWNNPAAIGYGTALSATQLNASASVAGSFSYDPAAGTVLSAGTHSLTASFTPTDTANYNSGSTGATVTVSKADPVVTWNNPATIVYGTALSATQLNASASVAGSFVYTPAAGAVLPAGTQTLSVTFTPNDAANYNPASTTAALVVQKATPIVTWSNPSNVVYGTALSATQLNASANVPGSFAYSPAAGTVLGAGTHALGTTFTPADTANYNNASGNASITVTSKALSIQTNNASKVYGQALPAFSVSGTGFVNGDGVGSLSGTATFSTSATATSAPGNYSVTPGGLSSPNYTITFVAGTLTIAQASTSVALSTSPNPSTQTQNVVITAVVAPVAPGAGTPTGTIEFRDNGVLLGSATLVNGTATLTKKFKKGTHPLTAVYSGSTNFSGSTGASSHVVP